VGRRKKNRAVLEHLLKQTEADIVLAPVVRDLLEQHPVARWQMVARRQGSHSASAGVRRVYLPLQGVVPSLPYPRPINTLPVSDGSPCACWS